ncbi:hypothetical protein [Thioalkalivibrio thiocyanodenitrificans]|uniref:hypothetical protein n=1 Tax=Thioalkalivibrio thiocyanodenitrificans TaxID=243063 RepID=UPI0003710DAC|nr:hypothetical protein [Thioalkalivibrio thiocyanodenitrificans]
MTRESLERHQIWIYLGAIAGGLGAGAMTPGVMEDADRLLWPVLGLLLFTTFTRIPMRALGKAAGDLRFNATLLGGNFVLVPAMVWVLVQTLPDDPVIRVAVAAVLLVPCTDWFITFTHLGGGDGARAIAASPLLLLAQLLLLPVYLVMFFEGGRMIEAGLEIRRILGAFVGLVVIPLIMAGLLQYWTGRHPRRSEVLEGLAWLPVPLLSVVVFLVAVTQVQVVIHWLPAMGHVTAVFIAYLVVAALAGRLLTRMANLPTSAGRTLVFSLGTRNSFVVLPLALALPVGWEAAVVVIVLQTLVELLGMSAYLRWVPGWLLPDRPRTP